MLFALLAYYHDSGAIKQILEHLQLSPPEEAQSSPAAHEVVRMPVDEGPREIEAPRGSPASSVDASPKRE